MHTIAIIRDYDIALRTELKRKEIKDDPKRAMELAAYLTHCKLQPVHLALCLRLAYTVFYKCKNLGLCATFCRRLLELNPGQQVCVCELRCVVWSGRWTIEWWTSP